MRSLQRAQKFSHTALSLFREETMKGYEDHLTQIFKDWGEWQQVLNYLMRSWLKPYKEQLVSAWTYTSFTLGTSTTNRLAECSA